MKVIIAGSRGITELYCVNQAVIESGFIITEVVSGKARGVDTLGENWADIHDIPVKPFPADWSTSDGGFIRNRAMGRYADALIAIRLGSSSGTTDMVNVATKYGLKVFQYQVKLNKWQSFVKVYDRFIN